MIIVFSIYSTAITVILSLLIFFAGYLFLSKLKFIKEEQGDLYFTVGISFFTGMALLLFSWSILTHLLSNADLSLYVILTLSLFFLYKNRDALIYLKTNSRKFMSILSIFLIIFSIELTRALIPMPEYFINKSMSTLNPLDGIQAVGHSFRAGNITNYILENNYFPKINQNSGQAIIASIPLFLGSRGTQFSLLIWLSTFIALFSILIYGSTRQYFIQGKFAIIPTLIVLLGNTSFSMTYLPITDIGSTLLFVCNIEGLFGIATFLVCLFLLIEAIFEKKFNNYWLLPFGLFAFVWNITGAHMILLFVILLLIIFIFYKENIVITDLKKILLTFILAGVIGGLTQGGMLYPGSYSEKPPIKGIMNVNTAGEPLLQLKFPWNGEPTPNPETISKPLNNNLKDTIKRNRMLYGTIQATRSFQSIFFPLLGLLLFYVLKKRKVIRNTNFNNFFQISSMALFTIGWIISNFIVLYGYSWPLTRFLYFGNFTAMYLLGISLTILLKEYLADKKIKHIAALSVLILIMFSGSFFHISKELYRNLLSEYSPTENEIKDGSDTKTLNFLKRFSALINIK